MPTKHCAVPRPTYPWFPPITSLNRLQLLCQWPQLGRYFVNMPGQNTCSLYRDHYKTCGRFYYQIAIRCQIPGNSKSHYYVSPHKLFDIYVLDISQCLNLRPLSEVVHGHQNKPMISCSPRERTNNVQPPLCKRPWAADRVQTSCQLMNQQGVLLTLLTLSYVLGNIFVYLWLPKSLGHCSMGQ